MALAKLWARGRPPILSLLSGLHSLGETFVLPRKQPGISDRKRQVPAARQKIPSQAAVSRQIGKSGKGISMIAPGKGTNAVLSQYDDTDVDYLSYWTARSYEHRAEVMALSRLLHGRRFGHAVDVGGGYGRLSALLSNYADRVTLADPSYRQLEVAERYLKRHPAIDTRLTDAAHLDFAQASVDLAIMVRVLHHLPDPAPELSEIARIVKVGGYAIIEAANIKHAVNRVRYWRNGERIPTTPVDRRSEENRVSGSIPFVNHHPAAIARQLENCGLHVERVLSVSNLRQPTLKRFMPERLMLAAEYTMQVPLAPLSFGPSLFFMTRKSANTTNVIPARPL